MSIRAERFTSHTHHMQGSEWSPGETHYESGKLRLVHLIEEPPFPQIVSEKDFLKSLKHVDKAKRGRIMQTYRELFDAYGDMTRRDGTPTVYHPIIVTSILLKAGITDSDIIHMALQHDTVEDTPQIYNLDESMTNKERTQKARSEIRHMYTSTSEKGMADGQRIANGVLFVTRPFIDGVEIKTEEERDVRYYQQLSQALRVDPLFVLVKLADRIHNLWTMDQDSVKRRRRQVSETLELYEKFFSQALKTLPEEGRKYLITLFFDGLLKLNVPLRK